MEKYDKHEYSSLLVRGMLREAIKYLEKFSEHTDLVNKYYDIYVHNNELMRSTNKVVNDLNKIYQEYYKDVFWVGIDHSIAETKLFENLWKFCGSEDGVEKNSDIEVKVEKIIKDEGYTYMGGRSAGYYGPYIWKTSNKETYDVKLPSGIEEYSVIMMEGFISRSWLDFLSFGEIGTGGWIGDDGTLRCISSAYDKNSPNFSISFLKHEAQHGHDNRVFPGITSVELEYRAKLVELIYWEDEKILKFIHLEANNTDERNTHSLASHRIISDLSRKIFGVDYETDISKFIDQLNNVKNISMELLDEDTNRLTG